MPASPTITGDLSPDAVRRYLADAIIPVRIACHTPAGGLWMVSLWYTYDEGTLSCATSAEALLVRYLREDPQVAFEVSTNDPPYRGVRGAGSASISADEDTALLRSLLERYLGGTDSDLARTLLAPAREEVRIDVEVEKLYGWDFSERMPGPPANGGRPLGNGVSPGAPDGRGGIYPRSVVSIRYQIDTGVIPDRYRPDTTTRPT